VHTNTGSVQGSGHTKKTPQSAGLEGEGPVMRLKGKGGPESVGGRERAEGSPLVPDLAWVGFLAKRGAVGVPAPTQELRRVPRTPPRTHYKLPLPQRFHELRLSDDCTSRKARQVSGAGALRALTGPVNPDFATVRPLRGSEGCCYAVRFPVCAGGGGLTRPRPPPDPGALVGRSRGHPIEACGDVTHTTA